MALLTYGTTPAKGATTTVTLDKAELVTVSAISSDAWWQDDDGDIVQAIVTLKSSPGNGKIVLTFDFTQNPCTAQLTLPAYCRDVFEISKITLIDTMGDKLTVTRSQLLVDIPTLAESEVDVSAPSVPANIQLLVTGESGAIDDSSSYSRTLTVVSGAAEATTLQARQGTRSVLINGSASKIETSGLGITTGDFTIETWIRPPTSSGYQTLFGTNRLGSTPAAGPGEPIVTHPAVSCWWFSNKVALVLSNSTYSATGPLILNDANGSITPGTWAHVAIVRSGSEYKLFRNGTQVGSTLTPGYPLNINGYIWIGAPVVGALASYNAAGGTYVDYFKVTSEAVYTTNFTPPEPV